MIYWRPLDSQSVMVRLSTCKTGLPGPWSLYDEPARGVSTTDHVFARRGGVEIQVGCDVRAA